MLVRVDPPSPTSIRGRPFGAYETRRGRGGQGDQGMGRGPAGHEGAAETLLADLRRVGGAERLVALLERALVGPPQGSEKKTRGREPPKCRIPFWSFKGVP